MKKRFIAILSGIWMLLSTCMIAHAIPVGIFSWEYDSIFGSVYHVENFSNDPDFSLPSLGISGESFFGVVIDLETGAGLYPLSLGEIPIGEARQSVEDLSGLNVASATLRFILGDPALPGLLTLRDGDGNLLPSGLTYSGSSALIDYEPSTVPEPATVLLMGSGIITIVTLGRRKLLPFK